MPDIFKDARVSSKRAQDLLDDVHQQKKAAALRDPEKDTSDEVAAKAKAAGWQHTGGPHPPLRTR